MTCGGCEKAVTSVLTATAGVESVTVDLPTQHVVVTGTSARSDLLAAIAKTGKTVVDWEG